VAQQLRLVTGRLLIRLEQEVSHQFCAQGGLTPGERFLLAFSFLKTHDFKSAIFPHGHRRIWANLLSCKSHVTNQSRGLENVHQYSTYGWRNVWVYLYCWTQTMTFSRIWEIKQLMDPIDFIAWKKNTNGAHQRFGYTHSSKYLLVFSRRKKLIQDCNKLQQITIHLLLSLPQVTSLIA